MTDHTGPVLAERDGLQVIDCRECGWPHLSEIPTAEALARFYESDFWQHNKANELAHLVEQSAWWRVRYGDWLSLVERATLGRTLLDVGSGYGFFLTAARERGWEVTGVEPSSAAADYCQAHFQIAPWRYTLDQYASVLNGKYDCLAALWVLEHLPDPKWFLRWCQAHLYGGGVLLLAVPNEWSKAQALANTLVQQKNYWVDHTHISYWDGVSLANLLGRCGFQIVERQATFPMETFIVDARANYVDQPELGPLRHKEIEEWEMGLTRETRLQMYRDMARHGEGRDLVILARPT